jgi:quercetin dioxygenase-like cupin family protein
MPVSRSVDSPKFQLNDASVTGLMAPSSGSTECILYRVQMPAGVGLPPHRHDHEDVFTVTEGSGTVHIDDETHDLAPGDTVAVPTGALHWVVPGDDGCTIVVTMLAGTLFIRPDGSSSVPPWGI